MSSRARQARNPAKGATAADSKHRRSGVTGRAKGRHSAFGRSSGARSAAEKRAGVTLLDTHAPRVSSELQARQLELEIQNEELMAQRAQLALQNERLSSSQQELLRARDALADLYELAPVGYVTATHDGLVLSANFRFAFLLGRDPCDIVRRSLSKYIVGDDHDVYYCHCRELRAGSARQTCELRMRRPSGATFWVAVESVVARSADGTAHVRSAVSDITRRKQAEQEQRRLKECLEQSQKMEAIATLAGGIAHDVNNILAVILALGSRLERNLPKQDATWQDVRDIVSAVFRGKKLTQDLLDFARRGPRQRRACCPNDVIRRLAGVLGRTTSTRIRIELALDEDLPCVECDRDQLTQMLTSICLNSVDAITEQGTIRIATAHVSPGDAELYVPPELSGVPHVRIDVTDDGVGMDAETQRRAFEPFFTTKEVGEGTGLGLSVVYAAVRELRGDVRIISRVDCGTTLRIVLPVCQSIGVRASSIPPGPENRAEGGSV